VILLTTNPAKYGPFVAELKTLGIVLSPPDQPLVEFQENDVETCARMKALWAARREGHAVLVDDVGLSLKAHPGFPGPMTGYALRTISVEGWTALTASDSGAEMICVLAWSDGERIESWVGRASGYLEPNKPVDPAGPGPLASWFQCAEGPLTHRRRALAAMKHSKGGKI
jgi:inosine/xanthosine triphosphate pyrophosphatase family protein